MKKIALALLGLILIQMNGNGQLYNADSRPQGKSHQISVNLLAPVDKFAVSHSVGMALNYQWSNGHFGRFDEYRIDSLNRVSFIAIGGVEFYLGKEDVNTAGYQFSFGNYLYLQALPGVLYRFMKNADMSFAVGPAFGIYESGSSFGIGGNLQAQYYLHSNFSLGPTLLYKKHSDADALWSVGVKVGLLIGK